MRRIARAFIITAVSLILILIILPPEFGGFIKLYYVSSGSMEPNIPIGSLLVTLPRSFTNIELGDVVVYLDRGLGRLVAHRVVGFEGDGYIIKADAGGSPCHVLREDVLGRVFIAIPFIGWLGIFSSLAPLAILVILAAILSPGSGSLYPVSSASSIIPLILPLREEFPRFLGGYTSMFLALFFTSSSIILYFLERGASGLLRDMVNLAYMLTSLASVSVVEVPQIW